MVVGDWHSELHEEAVYCAMVRLGHQVERFSWHQYFKPVKGFLKTLDHIIRRAQNKFIFGPLISRLNRDLIEQITAYSPDFVFVYRGTHISARTLEKIRELLPSCILVGYNNDDPFAPGHSPWLWRLFLKAIPQYDLMLAYRKANIDDFIKAGARRVEFLRSWFIPTRNYPINVVADDTGTYGCDVIFIGHYEPDNRVSCLKEIVRRGWHLRLFGPGYGWNTVIGNLAELKDQIPVKPLWGKQYNLALCSSKIALCFLSKLNRDTYTRRCFEIPATGTMMLAEYTDDLASLFLEGQEVEFFRSKEEMTQKIEYYLNNDASRKKIADGGLKRVHSDGHDVDSRMRQLLSWVTEVRESKKLY
jgi:spore maturation protein CgeB